MSKSKKSKPKFKAGPSKITRLEFSATHFRGVQFPSDMFYVGLANRIFTVINEMFPKRPGNSTDLNKRMAITLTCYVEDLVAGSGIWAAFTSLYRKKYGKRFPFYNLRESAAVVPYDDEFPSFHAVLFLLWYVANDAEPKIVLNPNNQGLRMLAMALMPDLVEAYDEAPESPARPMLVPEKERGVPLFYQVRNLCEWLCDRCYLTRITDGEKAMADCEKFMDELANALGIVSQEQVDYAIGAFMTMNTRIGPLAIPAHEWLAEMVTLYHEPEEEEYLPALTAIKVRPYEYYRYVTVGGSEAVLEDVDGEKITLSAFTMPDEKFPSAVAPGQSAMMSLVFFDGVWMMNGIGLINLSPELYEKYREIHRNKVRQGKEAYEYLFKAFGRKRIGVCGTYEEYLKLTCGHYNPTVGVDPQLEEDIRDAGNLLYFLDTDGTVSILPGWAPCVKVKDNPFYNKEEATRDGLSLIFDHTLTTPEMREYIIKNKLIPDAALNSAVSEETGRRLFQSNLRFFNAYTARDTTPPVVKVM